LHNNVGVALAKLGRKREAADHFRRALELKSDYRDARNNLAVLFGSSPISRPKPGSGDTLKSQDRR
jgi:hypothetical protein